MGFEYEGASMLRVKTNALVISLVCFAFSVYFAILSFRIIDMTMRTQLMALATSFFVGGIVVLICLIVSFALRMTLFKD